MADKVPDLDQSIGALIDIAVREFGEVEFHPVKVGDMTLQVLQVKNMQRYLDKLVDKTRSGKKVTLPLWAKVWPSCLVLGYTLTRFPFKSECSILEVGAGCAVNSMVLAKLGYEVTVSDVEPYALLFSKINALKNGLEDKMNLVHTDFTTDDLGARYDYIVGCEVLYEEAAYEPLADFLDGHLAESGPSEVLLALDQKRQGMKFFDRAQNYFAMMKSQAKFKDDEKGEEVVNLFRLRRK